MKIFFANVGVGADGINIVKGIQKCAILAQLKQIDSAWLAIFNYRNCSQVTIYMEIIDFCFGIQFVMNCGFAKSKSSLVLIVNHRDSHNLVLTINGLDEKDIVVNNLMLCPNLEIFKSAASHFCKKCIVFTVMFQSKNLDRQIWLLNACNHNGLLAVDDVS